MNKMMKAASVLAVVTMLTTGIVGGTFAKYATGATGADNARVAKFGVGITAESTSFGKSYKSADGTVSAVYNASTDSVNSSDNDKVIAPGTGDTVANIAISGTPEVDVKVTYDASITFNDKWVDANGNYYCPLVFTVNEVAIKGLDYASTDAFAAAIATKIRSLEATYPAGIDLSTASAGDISWKWEYETGSNALERAENNIKDTYLGDQAAKGNAATISITIKAEVVQID
ncbi:MAG: hypothetical protein PUB67_03365 [Clostridiales bacterium]|nr:hypothetical protein [Clostridiales bacterium]